MPDLIWHPPSLHSPREEGGPRIKSEVTVRVGLANTPRQWPIRASSTSSWTTGPFIWRNADVEQEPTDLAIFDQHRGESTSRLSSHGRPFPNPGAGWRTIASQSTSRTSRNRPAGDGPVSPRRFRRLIRDYFRHLATATSRRSLRDPEGVSRQSTWPRRGLHNDAADLLQECLKRARSTWTRYGARLLPDLRAPRQMSARGPCPRSRFPVKAPEWQSCRQVIRDQALENG
jgi:uncharacterized protein (UPF0262 family)